MRGRSRRVAGTSTTSSWASTSCWTTTTRCRTSRSRRTYRCRCSAPTSGSRRVWRSFRPCSTTWRSFIRGFPPRRTIRSSTSSRRRPTTARTCFSSTCRTSWRRSPSGTATSISARTLVFTTPTGTPRAAHRGRRSPRVRTPMTPTRRTRCRTSPTRRRPATRVSATGCRILWRTRVPGTSGFLAAATRPTTTASTPCGARRAWGTGWWTRWATSTSIPILPATGSGRSSSFRMWRRTPTIW